MSPFFIGLQHFYNQSKAFVQLIRRLWTTCPEPPYNLSGASVQPVRSLRTTCPKPSDNLSGTSGQDEISLKTWEEDGIKGGIRVLLHEKVRIY